MPPLFYLKTMVLGLIELCFVAVLLLLIGSGSRHFISVAIRARMDPRMPWMEQETHR